MTLLTRSLEVFSELGRSMVLGTVAMLVAVGFGWVMGRHRTFPPVRMVAWWITRIVLPLLKSRSWGRRAATIFINNTGVLTALLVLGSWRLTARIGVVILGLSLGMALRHLGAVTDEFAAAVPVRGQGDKRRIRVGVALNMLEPPAIVLSLGLSLGLRTIPLTPGQAWETFAVWVVPALFAADADRSTRAIRTPPTAVRQDSRPRGLIRSGGYPEEFGRSGPPMDDGLGRLLAGARRSRANVSTSFTSSLSSQGLATK